MNIYILLFYKHTYTHTYFSLTILDSCAWIFKKEIQTDWLAGGGWQNGRWFVVVAKFSIFHRYYIVNTHARCSNRKRPLWLILITEFRRMLKTLACLAFKLTTKLCDQLQRHYFTIYMRMYETPKGLLILLYSSCHLF